LNYYIVGYSPVDPLLDYFLTVCSFSFHMLISLMNSLNRNLLFTHVPYVYTVSQLIQQAVQQHNWKVLVTAPSNVAVDNVLARLVANQTSNNNNKQQQRSKSKKATIGSKKQQRLNVVRLGHPARLQEAILPYSLEALVQRADGTEIVADVRAELQSYLKILTAPHSKKFADRDKKRLAYKEVKALRKEVRQREEKTVQDLLDASHVVLATCVGAANHKLLQNQHFDLVVIDEAAQALEAACCGRGPNSSWRAITANCLRPFRATTRRCKRA